jgi:hypothetical protein
MLAVDTSAHDPDSITIRNAQIVYGLSAIATLLALASLAGQAIKFFVGFESFGVIPYGPEVVRSITNVLHLNAEHNIPTFYSVVLHLSTCALLALICLVTSQQSRPNSGWWLILSLLFLYLAFDEAFQLHERLERPARALIDKEIIRAVGFGWIIPGLTLALTVSLTMLRFVLSLPPKTRAGVFIAATLFLSGATGMEMLGGRYRSMHGIEDFGYAVISTIEESLEMAGVIVMIGTLLSYLATTYPSCRIRFVPD